MTTYRFEEIAIKRKRSYVDANGKRRQKTKTFYQTVNPFNKNKDGTRKTEEQIWKELTREADAWMALPDSEVES